MLIHERYSLIAYACDERVVNIQRVTPPTFLDPYPDNGMAVWCYLADAARHIAAEN